ncbi:ParB N-terminal domain-containing protein [Nocardia sp. BMG51109]|uniref:ParB N-terminal domain-containing protein n=1 Tax=Nocardia sp. BMG51109 TaxID=1056816 RepID=UPI0018DD88E3|nr:ParB N-terminal domain-containing protein [Nocardia sp. BMG51109]
MTAGGEVSQIGSNLAHLRPVDGPSTTEWVRISALVLSDSPRLAGEDRAHTLRLAETDAELPPILVHRQTMRVIDGVHRVHAAVHKGWTEIEALFFDGSAESAFVLAVEANIDHGLPLSLADRRAAAAKIIEAHRDWSDRMIARSTGLSPKTVRHIRVRPTEEDPHLHNRIGQDGRVRPLSAAVGRRLAAELIGNRPDASLREVARAAGISPGTVRDVRERLRRGEDPALPRANGGRRAGGEEAQPRRRQYAEPVEIGEALQTLGRDPSLRHSDSGRQLLRWLRLHIVDADDCAQIVGSAPDHSVRLIADLAGKCAENWAHISAELEKRFPD